MGKDRICIPVTGESRPVGLPFPAEGLPTDPHGAVLWAHGDCNLGGLPPYHHEPPGIHF